MGNCDASFFSTFGSLGVIREIFGHEFSNKVFEVAGVPLDNAGSIPVLCPPCRPLSCRERKHGPICIIDWAKYWPGL